MIAALGLVVLGELGIYSACGGLEAPGGDAAPPSLLGAALRTFWGKQILWIAAGLAVFAATLVPSYTRLAAYSYLVYLGTVAVLALLAALRFGRVELRPFIYPTNNAYSWIHFPGISFQPSELTKIAFIMALAYYLRFRTNFRTLGGLLPPFLMALVPTALGTAMLFLPVLFVMLFAAGARPKHLAAILAAGFLLVPVFYLSMKGYQRMRIDSWLLHPCAERLHFAIREADQAARQAAPLDDLAAIAVAARLTDDQKTVLARRITGMWQFRLWRAAARLVRLRDGLAARLAGRLEDPPTPFDLARGRLLAALAAGTGPERYEALRQFFSALLSDQGHHLWQMQIAVGSGGPWGRGWLEGTQARYVLPEAHADSLFAVLAEQFGFWGGALVVILYALLFLFGLEVSFSTTEPYGRLIVVGVVALFAAQSFLNLAMSIGLAPITGIPLPLMSYGGSSMVSSFLALGLLCNVALRRLFLIAPRPFEWQE
jgi:rod shape determining protein RodA